jgi:hypothetical protein
MHPKRVAYFDELEPGDGGQLREVWVVEGACGMGWVLVCDAEDDPRGRRGPVGRREREAIVGTSVKRVSLKSSIFAYHILI